MKLHEIRLTAKLKRLDDLFARESLRDGSTSGSPATHRVLPSMVGFRTYIASLLTSLLHYENYLLVSKISNDLLKLISIKILTKTYCSNSENKNNPRLLLIVICHEAQ